MKPEAEHNPYAPPAALGTAPPGIPKGFENLLRIAKFQRGLIVCIVSYLAGIMTMLLFGQSAYWIFMGSILLVSVSAILGWIFLIRLTYRLFGLRIAWIVGFCYLIPLVGFFVMLVMSSRAGWLLREAGFKTGLFGADTRSMPSACEEN